MPGYEKFFKMLEKNTIRDCPITLDDVKRCLIIYGKELAKVKGATTRKSPDKIQTLQNLPIPKMIIDNHNEDAISLYFIFVQGIPFLHSISESYKNRKIEPLRGKKKTDNTDITNMSKRVVNTYHARGIRVSQVNADNEFKVLGDKIAPTKVNIVGAGEHVGNIERSGRTIQERTRCHVHRLPHKRYPAEMTCGCVIKSVKDLNFEIPRDGLSKDLPPSTLIHGTPLPTCHDIQKSNFGDYV